MSNKIAIYPGTFDPITHGHVDVLSRVATIFDKIFLAIADNPGKNTLFTAEERVHLATAACSHLNNVEVSRFSGLTVDFARKKNAKILVRGLRSCSDFDFERQIAIMNQQLMPELETVFFLPTEKWACVSSSLVKEIGALGGEVSSFVPAAVTTALLMKKPKQ